MTRLIALVLSASMLLAPGGGQDKVTICHKGNTITIGAPAVDAHLQNHGDYIGACAEGELGPIEPPLEPPPTTTTTTTVPPSTTTTTLPPPTTEPPDHSHEHSHDEMVLRCTVIDDG